MSPNPDQLSGNKGVGTEGAIIWALGILGVSNYLRTKIIQAFQNCVNSNVLHWCTYLIYQRAITQTKAFGYFSVFFIQQLQKCRDNIMNNLISMYIFLFPKGMTPIKIVD